MGHLINPLSFRLGLTSFWKFNSVNYFLKTRERHIVFFFDSLIFKFLSWYIRSNWYFNFFKMRFKKFKISSKSHSRFLFVSIFKNKYKFFKDFQLESHCNFVSLCAFDNYFDFFSYFEDELFSDSVFFNIDYYNFFNTVQSKNFSSVFFIFLYGCFYIYGFLLQGLFIGYKRAGRLVWYRKKFLFPDISHFVIYRSGILSIKIILYFMHTAFEKMILREFYGKSSNFVSIYKSDILKYLSLYRIGSFIFDALYYPLFFIFLLFRFFFKFCFVLLMFKDFFFFEFDIFLNFLFSSFFSFYNYYLELKRLFFYFSKKFIFIGNFVRIYLFLKRFFFFESRYRFLIPSKVSNNHYLSNFKLFIIERFFSGSVFFYLAQYMNTYFFPMKIIIKYKLLSSNSVSAYLLYLFFVRNLKSRKPINKIVSLVISDLRVKKGLIGFRILTSGRFTRKERAFYKWMSINRVPLSVYNSVVDYYAGVFKSRFGICSLRIWLFKKI